MARKHDLKQLQGWARDFGMGRWFNAHDVDNERPPPKKKPFNKQGKPLNNKKGKR